MSEKPSKLWIFGPPVALLALGFAYYVRVASFRHWVDVRFPAVQEKMARFVPEPEVIYIPASQAESPTPADAAPPEPPVPPAPPEPLDMRKLAADRTLWPPSVAIRKPVEFPAVVDGKVVGKLTAPAGSEARVSAIKNAEVGLEYRGGGAWVKGEETDLLERAEALRSSRPAPPRPVTAPE